MDIEKTWKQLTPADEGLTDITSIGQLKQPEKPSPLKRMKRLLKWNMIWAVLLGVLYLAIICFYHYWQIQTLVGLLLGFNAWSVYSAWPLYKNINTGVLATNLLAELKRNDYALQQWIKIQTQVALFIYPFSICGGFLLGGVVGSGKSIGFFMSKPLVIIALIISVLVLTPLAYLLCKWMFKRSFGKIQNHFKQMIAELSQPENPQ